MIAPPLAPVMWAINTAISAYTAIDTGNALGFVGGLVGGAAFGIIGKKLSLSLVSTYSKSFADSFIGGAIEGALEFGTAGFGAGLGGGLAGGASFNDAIRMGGVGAAAGAATGAIIQGSYAADWQRGLHGNTRAERYGAIGVPREVGLYKGYSDITPVGKNVHHGVETTDNYWEYNIRAEFDPAGPVSKAFAHTGLPVIGKWKIRNMPFQHLSESFSNNLGVIKAAYNNITSQVGNLQIYGLGGIPKNCQTAAYIEIRRALRTAQQ